MKENNAKCSICGKGFYRKPSLLKRAKNPTCSNECRNKVYKVDRVIVPCSICGKDIEMTKNRNSIRKILFVVMIARKNYYLGLNLKK